MKESTSKPLSDPVLDAFTEAVDKAMRRAYLVAKKEAARYGLKLIVNRPRPSSRKAATARRSRRALESV